MRDLDLDFTIVQCLYGKNTVVDLKPNGSSIPVTNESRVEYINLVANYKLNTQVGNDILLSLVKMLSYIIHSEANPVQKWHTYQVWCYQVSIMDT